MIDAHLTERFNWYCQRCLAFVSVRGVMFRRDKTKRFDHLGAYCDDCLSYVREHFK